jgi:hypothetical protein
MEMKKGNLEFNVTRNWRDQGFDLRGMVSHKGKSEYLSSINITVAEPGECIPPFMALTEVEASSLMDTLWVAGVRPSCGEGHIGELNATKTHLNDMKTIAFSQLKIKQKEK